MNNIIAERRLKQFQHKFGEAMLEFATHAALPVVLNSELVHLLRLNFFSSSPSIDYLTEAEFLLSSFCREIGEDLYEMEPAIRTVLLQKLSQQRPERIKEIAALLWQYSERYTPWRTREGLQNAQLLTALNFLDAQKAIEWFQEVEASYKALLQEDREWFVAMKNQIENISIDSEESQAKPIVANSRDALVVCICQYTDLWLLEQLANSAEKIAQILEIQGGFCVKRLPSMKRENKDFIDPEQLVTASELRAAIIQLFFPESNNIPHTVLLFFAGHGLRKKIEYQHYEGFLATSEANPNDDEWGVSLKWLRELLETTPIQQQQIVWIDASYSGELFNFTVHDSGHDRCFISSTRAHEAGYAEPILTESLLETLDYTKKLNPWVDNYTLIELLEQKSKTAVGSQRFIFENTGNPIILTNKAFDVNADYKNICPFKGLTYFDDNANDPLYFKGRTQLTNELIKKVKGANFLAVLGASGSGKSSVVRAGLLYQLRQTQRWQILPVITPTAHPLKALGTVISMPTKQLTDFINQAQVERVVLVIDQFEEVFTLCQNNTEREQFFATLLADVERADNKFCLVIVMRADFLSQCSHYVALANKIQAHQIIVTPMIPAELEEAIVAPIQQVGLQIESKLVAEMLADVKGALGSLPLLQYALTELWKKCATHRLLTFSAYEELGKIVGTLAQGANTIYQGLSVEEQKIAKQIFMELTQLGEGTSNTRRQLPLQDLVTSLPFEPAFVNQVIHKFVAAGLLVTDKLKKEQTAVINIAHEALIQYWGLLHTWIDENRDFLRWRRKLNFYVNEWESHGRDKELLLRGSLLIEAKEILKEHADRLSVHEQDFIEKSINKQKRWWKPWA